jgi:hypothetical protein
VAAIRNGSFTQPVLWSDSTEPEAVIMSPRQCRQLRGDDEPPAGQIDDPTARTYNTQPLPTSRAMTVEEFAEWLGPEAGEKSRGDQAGAARRVSDDARYAVLVGEGFAQYMRALYQKSVRSLLSNQRTFTTIVLALDARPRQRLGISRFWAAVDVQVLHAATPALKKRAGAAPLYRGR